MFTILRLFSLSLFALNLAVASSHPLVTDLNGGYQLVAVDLNHDGRLDLIAVASGQTELAWYENPTWERHVLATGLPHLINAAAYDYDGDGVPEIAIAYEFSSELDKSIGVVAVLHHSGDVRLPWTLHEIDRLPTSHRLRWANLFGDGHRVLVNVPLRGLDPQRVPLVFYRPGQWKRETLSNRNGGVQHGVFLLDWDARGQDDLLTASDSGIHLHRFRRGAWHRTELSPMPASDVAAIGTGKARQLAAIEPWHGNIVAVYELEAKRWQRTVIDSSIVDGHTLFFLSPTKLLVGYRGNNGGVNLYTRSGGGWSKSILGEMKAAACIEFEQRTACIGGTEIRLFDLQ